MLRNLIKIWIHLVTSRLIAKHTKFPENVLRNLSIVWMTKSMNIDLYSPLRKSGRGPKGLRGAWLRFLLRRPVLHVRYAEPRVRTRRREGDQAFQENWRPRGQLGPRMRLQHPRGLNAALIAKEEGKTAPLRERHVLCSCNGIGC